MYIAGYSIQTTTIDNDGLKIREVQSNNKLNGKYLYVNICSSIIIENPVDKYGRIIKENSNLFNVMDDISIPLVVGVIRDVVDKNTSKDSLVIDVVFNPIIINLIKNNKNFKTQISELALEWVIKETGLKCDLKWEYCNNGYEYQYGRGDNKDIPVLFFVTLNEKGEPISSDQTCSSSSRGNSSSSSSGSSRGSNRDVLSSPTSLLGQITKEKSNTSTVGDDTTINIDILKPLKSTTKAPTNITASTKSSLSSSSSSSSSSTISTTAVESKNKVLIEEVGVSQQQNNDVINDTATQSSPSMPHSTTTTITTTTLSKPQLLSSSTLPIPPLPSSLSTLSASSSSLPQHTTASSSSSSSQPTATLASLKPPSKMEFAHMEQLLGRFDEDYTTPSVIGNDFGQSTLLVCTLFNNL
jgi:hypothetical protein